MKGSHDLPPAIHLLLDEDLTAVESPPQLAEKLQKLAPELIRQSRWTTSSYLYPDSTVLNTIGSGRFQLRASGALDPFSAIEICPTLGCRVAAAEHFARTAGVLADTVVVPDVVTPAFAELRTFDAKAAEWLIGDLRVLDRLKPLVRAGVVNFSDARLGYCQKHNREVFDRVVEVTEAILNEVEAELDIEAIDDVIEVRTTSLFSQPMMLTHTLTDDERVKPPREVGLAAFRDPLSQGIAALVRDMRSAQKIDATLASGSRVGLMAIARIEQRAPLFSEVENWEALRSVELPWIRTLSPGDVVRLREEAATGLPRSPLNDDSGRIRF